MISNSKTLTSDEFRNIYESHQLFVRKNLYWLVSKDWTDDVLQEVFVKIWKSWPKFNHQSSLKTWIYRITINCAYDFLRKQKRGVFELPAMDEEPGDSPEHELATERLVRELLNDLSMKQRDVFLLFYLQNLSLEQVASILEIPEGTVKSRLANCRKMMEEKLIKHGVTL